MKIVFIIKFRRFSPQRFSIGMLNAISQSCCFNTLEWVVKQYLIILFLSFGFIDLLVCRNLWLTATVYGVFWKLNMDYTFLQNLVFHPALHLVKLKLTVVGKEFK